MFPTDTDQSERSLPFPEGIRSLDAVFDADQRIINPPVQLSPEDTATEIVPALFQTLGIDVLGEFLEARIERLKCGDDGRRISTPERVGEIQPLIQ